jgi:hypothetical protein
MNHCCGAAKTAAIVYAVSPPLRHAGSGQMENYPLVTARLFLEGAFFSATVGACATTKHDNERMVSKRISFIKMSVCFRFSAQSLL